MHRDAVRRVAEIVLRATGDGRSLGRATLFELRRGVLLVLNVDGAAPGRYGAHLHEGDDCLDPAGARAGGHWDPDLGQHGLPPWLGRHLGDLGNVEVGTAGGGQLQVMIPDANLEPGDRRSVIGRALLLKAGPDDGTPPFGGVQRPLACGTLTSWQLPRGGIYGARYR